MSKEKGFTPEILRRAKESTVLIALRDSLTNHRKLATGICIDADEGIILSVDHLFRELKEKDSVVVLGEKQLFQVQNIGTYGDDGYDLAVVHLKDYKGGLQAVPLIPDEIHGIFDVFIESRYFVSGEKRIARCALEGIVAQERAIKDPEYASMENAVYAIPLVGDGGPWSIISRGASGSGVFTNKGLVGIVSTMFDAPSESLGSIKVATAMKSSKIHELLSRS